MSRQAIALIPLRSPGRGKSRLSPHLTADERASLSGAMLADVVTALRAADMSRLLVAVSGPEAAAAASALGVDVMHDPPGSRGLDDVIRAATTAVARESALLVVAADLPRLTPADVTRLLEEPDHVVVAPTSDGGTGGLLRRPPNAIPTAYGPHSAANHVRRAREAGLTASMVHVHGFNHDVDTWEDLVVLLDEPMGRATTAFLDRSGLHERLTAAAAEMAASRAGGEGEAEASSG